MFYCNFHLFWSFKHANKLAKTLYNFNISLCVFQIEYANNLPFHYSVLMKGITWSRDSHGLFDYESRHLTKKTLKASYESMIMRSGNDLSLNRYNN